MLHLSMSSDLDNPCIICQTLGKLEKAEEMQEKSHRIERLIQNFDINHSISYAALMNFKIFLLKHENIEKGKKIVKDSLFILS